MNQPQTSRRGSGSKPGGQITESTNNTRLVRIAIVFEQETALDQPIARGFSRSAQLDTFGTLSTDITTAEFLIPNSPNQPVPISDSSRNLPERIDP